MSINASIIPQNEEWYQLLVEECRAILTERGYNSNLESVTCKGEVGERICEDSNYKKFGKGNGKFNQRLFDDIHIGTTNGYYCIEFYERVLKEPIKSGKYEDVSTAVKTIYPKNLRWTAIRGELPPPTPPKSVELPEGKYDVIYIDPPWQYSNSGISGAAENHYPTMTIEQLGELKIPSADNATMFVWVTNPILFEAVPLIEKWGFEYKTNMVWIKDIAGQGFYVKGQHELLLICVKGNHRPDDSLYVRSVVQHPRLEHSQKPEVFYEIIEKLYPKAKYLEMFARNKREGWTSWGNEI
jgi:N6-adenosine-specific RNA methylase IME4